MFFESDKAFSEPRDAAGKSPFIYHQINKNEIYTPTSSFCVLRFIREAAKFFMTLLRKWLEKG